MLTAPQGTVLLETVYRLAHHVQGTCMSIDEAAEQLDLDPLVDWEDKLLDHNIELCGVCRWWHESCELEFDEAQNFGVCEQCRGHEEDD